MANLQLRSVIRQLRRVIVAQGGRRAPSDAQLLQAFIHDRDEGAVEMLVWRHGAMVLNLCRRVLRDEHLAEDAFQATFLVFVRKANSIGKHQSVGSWLCKVAYRIAQRLRRKLARHPEQWAELDDLPARASADDLIWRDVRSVLNEEIHRLPERYRSPIVLCYLQGHTHKEVAELLGCPPGTFRSRLARGLERLRSRLAQRGLAVSAGGLAMSLSMNTSPAAVPALLVDTTMQAAMAFAAGHTAQGLMSSSVAALTQGALRAMFLSKLKNLVAILVAVAVLGVGAGSVAQWALAGPQPNRESGREAVLAVYEIAPGQQFSWIEVLHDVRDQLVGQDVWVRVAGQDVQVQLQAVDQDVKIIWVRARDAQDKVFKESFLAQIKKVVGNKVTNNRSDEDNKFKDQILTASDKVVVTIQDIVTRQNKVIDDGLKSALFAKERDLPARVTVDAKNNITEIQMLVPLLGNVAIPDGKKPAAAQQGVPIKIRQDEQPKKVPTERFLALIKKVDGNKLTINRSDEDNKFKDEILTALDTVVVKGGNDKALEDGLKHPRFAKEVDAFITVDAKNNITEIQLIKRVGL